MSIPVGFCTIAKAANGDQKAYAFLVGAMDANIRCGHWTQFSCGCDPKCTTTKEALDALNKRLEVDPVIIEATKHAGSQGGPKGPEGPK